MQLLGQGDALERRQQIVEQHVEPEPRGVGTELLARQRLGRQLVGQHVVGVLDGVRLAPVPADQVEAGAAVRVGQIGHDREMLDLAAVGEQPALLLADAAHQVARRRDGRFILPHGLRGVRTAGPQRQKVQGDGGLRVKVTRRDVTGAGGASRAGQGLDARDAAAISTLTVAGPEAGADSVLQPEATFL